MKLSRTFFKISPLLVGLLVALSGCGGGDSARVSMAPAQPVTSSTTATNSSMPTPDCAPDGCKALRIIDGNAEAWRVDAAKRAARDSMNVPST